MTKLLVAAIVWFLMIPHRVRTFAVLAPWRLRLLRLRAVNAALRAEQRRLERKLGR